MRPRGYSLAEAIMALALTALAVFSLLFLQSYSLRWKTKSNLRHQASMVAQSLLEDRIARLRADFEGHFDLAPTPANRWNRAYSSEMRSDLTPFTLQAQITDENSELKKVVILVSWHDNQGDQAVHLVSYVYSPP